MLQSNQSLKERFLNIKKKTSLLTEKEIPYGFGRNLLKKNDFREKNPRMVDTIMINFFHCKGIEKSSMKNSFCNLGNQAVINPPMASHVSS